MTPALRFLLVPGRRSSATACPLSAVAGGRGHAALRLQRGGDPGALRGARRRRSAAIRTGCTTRSRPTPRSALVHAAARARQRRRRQLDLGDRRRAPRRLRPRGHRLHRRRQVDAASSSGGAARPAGHQRRVGRRARAHRGDCRGARPGRPRRHPHQSRHRRAEPSAHFDRPEDQQVRRAGRRRARRCSTSMAARPHLRLVAIHVHVGSQITSLDAAAQRGALSRSARRRARRPAASCSNTSISAADSAFPTTAPRSLSPADVCRRARRRGAPHAACRSSSSRAGRSSARPAPSSRTVIDLKPRATAASSPCSTPA